MSLGRGVRGIYRMTQPKAHYSMRDALKFVLVACLCVTFPPAIIVVYVRARRAYEEYYGRPL